MIKTFLKDPDSTLSYGFDWAAWLATGETISASTWIVPAGITKEAASNTTTSTTILVSGGTSGSSYEITNRITTSAGQVEDRSFIIAIKSR